MIEQEILRLNLQRENLYNKLHQVNTKLLVQGQELDEITMNQGQNYQDQTLRIEENISFMSNKIMELNNSRKQISDEKNKITENINKYSSKRESLNSTLVSYNKKLQQIKANNLQIEEQIKLSRLQYEYLQENIFNLDIKIQNFKKYGMDIVPQQIAVQLAKKQQLTQQKQELDKRIEIQKAELEMMFSIYQNEKIVNEIQSLELKTEQIKQLKKVIQELKIQNQTLNKIKNQYEWNPNCEIKQLEINQQEQQQKISSIDKEILAIRKKLTQCLQKIQNYKNYLKKQQTLRKEKQISCLKDQKSDLNQGNLKISKYCEIKRDLQIQTNKRSISFLDSVRQVFNKKKLNNQNIIIDQRTYRVNKKINILQLILILIIILVLLYFTHIINRKN